MLDLFLFDIKAKSFGCKTLARIEELQALVLLSGVVKYGDMLFLVIVTRLKIRAIHVNFTLP